MTGTSKTRLWIGRSGLALLFVACTVLANPVADYRLKAAIVYNFALFTNWPADALPVNDEFVLCFLNAPAIRMGMQELSVSTLLGRRLVLQAVDGDGDEAVRACQVLVVGTMSPGRWNGLQRSLAGQPVLTVSDKFRMQDGVMMAMETRSDRIVFDIDNTLSRRAGLAPSSKLLRLARSVR